MRDFLKNLFMCGSQSSVQVNKSAIANSSSTAAANQSIATTSSSSSSASFGYAKNHASTSSSLISSSYGDLFHSGSSISSATKTSLSNLRRSLPDTPHIYDFSEISAATGGFHADRVSSSSTSSSWRCSLRNQDVILIQRKLRRPIGVQDLQRKLSLISRSHHSSLCKLLGVSVSGNYIYLAYEFVVGVDLLLCLRNPRNPNFTVLSKWLSRVQIATDVAHGLDYIHNCCGVDSEFVHNHIKSTSIIVTEPNLNAKICHFGTAELCGEVPDKLASRFDRLGSGQLKFEGTRGYMAPEFQVSGTPTKQTDVYAFGVVLLELFSGRELLKYSVNEETGGFTRVSLIETAREALMGDSSSGYGKLRQWVDKRLRDSYPVEVANKMVRLALDCVDEDPKKRLDMAQIVGSVSKMYLESKNWADRMLMPEDISVSMAPR
ncbi:unnamed protein product [Rhodiola kirilowii]